MKHNISLVVATKDRPDDLRRLLQSLRTQAIRPAEVVVVDSSGQPVEFVVKEFADVGTRYLRHHPPSASAQRNAGIRACSASSTLIGFADDDSTFEPDAFAAMLRFWEQADADVLGASFNVLNSRERTGRSLKRSRLAAVLGLYPEFGGVACSGWQSVMGRIPATRFVGWLSSGAVLWRRNALSTNLYDEYFDSYSYLEDLDISYSIGRRGRLAVVAEAGYHHFHSGGGRISQRQFGRIEVRNRLYFVRKHGLSVPRCFLGIAIRMAMTVSGAVCHRDRAMLQRACGNVEALWHCRRGRAL